MKRRCWFVLFSALQLALFTALTLWVQKHPHPAREIRLIRRMQQKRSPLAQRLVSFGSMMVGESTWLNGLALPTALLFWLKRLRLEALMTLFVIWGGALVRSSLQHLIRRPRPTPTLLLMSDHKHTKSYPSGHVSMAVLFWGWLLALSRRFCQGWSPWQKRLLNLPGVFLFLIGPSRVYLGDHWGTDVIGGYLFGGSWLNLSVAYYLTLHERGVLASPQHEC